MQREIKSHLVNSQVWIKCCDIITIQLTKENVMSEVPNEVAQAVEAVAPESIAAQAIEAAVETSVDHSPIKIVEDLALAHSLWSEFKAKIAGLHPSVANIFKALF